MFEFVCNRKDKQRRVGVEEGNKSLANLQSYFGEQERKKEMMQLVQNLKRQL